jgi:hypothetical protein
MKPKAFIGSSREGLDIANAIHTALTKDAECTVWNAGVFGLSGNTLGSLMEHARASDFGIFVFSPDDTAEIRGQRLLVARDNVLYELGLFSGYLEPGRCYFALPDGVPVHIPSDLAGITSGTYEASRVDENWIAAVTPFCNQIRTKIRALGMAVVSIHDELREMAVRFECADWIPATPDMNVRVRQRETIVGEMARFCQSNQVNKRRLLAENRPGFNVALAAAIQARSANSDADLVVQIDPSKVTRGVAQHTLILTIEKLQKEGKIPNAKKQLFVDWLSRLRDVVDTHKLRIEALNNSLK